MATEYAPTRGIISLYNRVVPAGTVLSPSIASLISVTSEASLYPGVNLLNGLRSKRWRSTTVGSDQFLSFDLGTPHKPVVFALIDSNIDGAKTIVLQSSNSPDFSTNLRNYTYTTYAQSEQKVLRFFVGTSDGGYSDAHQYWRVKIAANSQKSGYSYFEVGNVWLGPILEVDIDVGFSIDVSDDSDEERAYNGARYLDVIRSTKSVSLTLPLIPVDTMYGIKEFFDSYGSWYHLLIDVFGTNANDKKRQHGAFYGNVSNNGVSYSQELQVYGNVEFEFDEAVG